jgi:hypothetical protein
MIANTASPTHDVLLVLNACSVAFAKCANGVSGAGWVSRWWPARSCEKRGYENGARPELLVKGSGVAANLARIIRAWPHFSFI